MRITPPYVFVAIILFSFSIAFAQEVQPKPADTLAIKFQNVMNDLAVLKKLKFSGFVQVQYQHADEPGIKTFAGGDFPKNVQNRFTIRRGRIKLVYEGDVTQVTFQIDATEKGVVIKETFIKLSEPWTKWLSLTAGLFIRPFNCELDYPSPLRESPERARMTQTLFPGERDVGAMVSVQPPAENKLHLMKLDVGFVNGAGIHLDFDGRQDAFGKISAIENSADKKFNYKAGFSFYVGGVRESTDTLYKMNGECYEAEIDSSDGEHYSRRNYYGADAEVSYKSKLGATILRGEFTQGIQSGTLASNTSFTNTPETHIYERNFNGAVVYLIQGFFKDKHQLVVKYDFFDPNIAVKGDEIQSGCGITATDIKYHTIGFGYSWAPNKYLKFTAYYDLVKNETAPGIGITDDIEDNVLTMRTQVKF